LLIEVGADSRVRGWPRHGTSLTGRLGELIAAFADTPAGSVFDGELVAVSEREGRPIQDFATVGRAVLGGDVAAAKLLRFVGFDLLGTVLKRPSSVYRPGRHGVWLKHKARHTAEGVLLAVRQDRDGQWHGICDVGGRRVVALVGASSTDHVGELVSLIYSRVDADGGLREVLVVLFGGSPTACPPAAKVCVITQGSHAPISLTGPWLAPSGRQTGSGATPLGEMAAAMRSAAAKCLLAGQRGQLPRPESCLARRPSLSPSRASP
jgi:hypothetical protein